MKKADPSQEEDPLRLLQDGAAALGISLPTGVLPCFQNYLRELQTWNTRINLTGLRTARDIILKGFLDSLAVLPFLDNPPSLADLGSGAGFPGLVLKLARPALALTLVESRGKKAAFLEYVISLWLLPEVEVVQVHLTPGLAREWGPRFAAVISRAAFPLDRFLDLAAPLLLPGGRALALKGPVIPAKEIQTAQRRLEALGLEVLNLERYSLPLSGEVRLVAVAQKLGERGSHSED
ncbi:MAG: 16S rRNA (guanine(527)-N(7))-methyltransferase RsmG [Desulfobaccales bacterium]